MQKSQRFALRYALAIQELQDPLRNKSLIWRLQAGGAMEVFMIKTGFYDK